MSLENDIEEQNAVQDNDQGAKDGASLAKNAASGNYLGAAKDAVNLAKNKKVRRKVIIHSVLSIVIPFILIIAAAGFALYIFVGIADAIESVITAIGEFFQFDLDDNLKMTIDDENIDKIIEEIEATGVDLDSLHLVGDMADYDDPNVQEKNNQALRKYVKQFCEAQAATQGLYPKTDWNKKDAGKEYGTVYVQRTNPNDSNLSDTTHLEYIKISEMEALVSQGKTSELKKYFSVDNDGKLVLPSFTQTIIEENGTTTKNETAIQLIRMDYKAVISQYTTSMNFFLYLTMVTQNPEFASAVADLVKDSEITITLMDKVSTNITNEERNYTVHTKTRTKEEDITYDEDDVNKEHPHTSYHYETTRSSENKKDITKTTIITTTPVPAVNYARTWFSEQKIEYNKTNTTMAESTYNTEAENEEEPSISGERNCNMDNK